MGRYVARRLLQFLPVLLGTLFLVHYLTALGIQINGDPVRALFGPKEPNASTLRFMRDQFNLGDPCLTQPGNPCVGMFVERLGRYAQGDFGTNYSRQPVTALLGRAWPITLRLAVIAIVFETILGILAGVVAALRKDKLADNAVRISTVLLVSVPSFVFGVLVQIGFGRYVRAWLAGIGAPDWTQHVFTTSYQPNHEWLSLVIPGFVLAAFSLASIARLTRTSVIENLRADYVRTARAKGLRHSRVLTVHALRNSLIPVVTFIGIDLGFLLGGAVVTEGIFNIPGVGRLTYVAASTGEVPVIVALVTMLTLIFLVASVLVDLVYALLDSRIRYE